LVRFEQMTKVPFAKHDDMVIRVDFGLSAQSPLSFR